MTNIVLLFVCLLVGIALRAFRRVPENAHVAINGFIIHVSLPALILAQIHKIEVAPALLSAVAMPWLLFALAAALFAAIGKLSGISAATTGALIKTAGLGNTSFVGLPMIECGFRRSRPAIPILKPATIPI